MEQVCPTQLVISPPPPHSHTRAVAYMSRDGRYTVDGGHPARMDVLSGGQAVTADAQGVEDAVVNNDSRLERNGGTTGDLSSVGTTIAKSAPIATHEADGGAQECSDRVGIGGTTGFWERCRTVSRSSSMARHFVAIE